MPDESPVKRKIELEELNENLKRTKSIGHEDLKSIVINEFKNLFENRIARLEARVKYLEDELDLKVEDQDKNSDSIHNDNDNNDNNNDQSNDKQRGENDIDVDVSRDDEEIKSNEKTETSKNIPPALPPRAQFGGSNTFQFKPNTQNQEAKSPSTSNKPVFGATTPFGNINKHNSTKSEQNNQKTEPKVVPVSSKPVFGATTSFGNMNKNNNNTKEKENQDENINKSKSTTPSAGGFSTFGSKSRFGNAFQESIKQKSFLDSPSSSSGTTTNQDGTKEQGTHKDGENEDEEESGKSTNKDALPTSTATQQFKQVDLNPIEQTTGEEEESSKFNCTAKLFELKLTSIDEGWKERGVGPLHLNQSNNFKNQIRLVMRSQGLLKVILNYKIQKDTEILKGLEASLNPGKYLRLNSLSDGKPIQYLLKFSNERIRDELINNIEELQREI
ncbi:uncharacterized protein KGF55_000521 [Candida pseudojiufengensis]|uniref:uncharacterized protein n=1 Tax=Candida pseudojiufengensis TaxID=497109 RepID=UPI002224F592|nr:uncharacterized protein KGF55_000521 [Candida pseudojiufengensis]KAI5966212.1 hypothetical protein KGF55_000521 [Candida pseudojiufengensis]